MVKTLGLSAFATFLFVLAIFCLFFPSKVQAIADKAVNWGIPSNVKTVNSYMRLVARFVQSNQYRICVRLIGLLSLLFSLLVLWMLEKHLRGEY